MPAPEKIRQLVARFEEHREAYRLSKYNETQLRREFLDPFFEELGWDVLNRQSYAEAYKEVIHEDSLEVEGALKAPDYAFRVGGQRKFFVEAKKPHVNIQSDVYPAFQLRRYSWSAKLPLGVLSDFEEFAIYDCRNKPDKKDKASTGRVAFYSYRDYIEKWDEIAAIFSREAVLKGSFDQYAEGVKGKKGTAEVDDAFLAEIERWREVLARNFALRNPSLTTRELNYAVQMTIDRIIFLRICEDRGIERYEKLKEVSQQENVYEGLCQIFQQADARYNSGLFHFKDERDSSSPADNLTLGLSVDDKVLREILGSLYYPESPYVFSEIPADILGQVYERFLGKVIRLTAGHQAKVEEKPEVRKAGGVFYTPTFIVENIVQNTVGRIVNPTYTPKEVARLKFLDPACGSGTFPLGAFQYLLDWHLKYYLDHDPEKWAAGKNPAIYQSKDGYKLTTAKKKEILLNNIFAVDIDAQAVEVTKLSLLLKVLEDESHETIGSQLALLQERVLPDLGHNIKCGNSLIGYDYFDGRMLVEPEERERVNAFDWQAEFPQVFAQGGFDAVFGNPPYIRIQVLQETSSINVEYYRKTYQAASKGNYDIYVVFVEKALSLLNEKGRLGFILPHKFFNAQYGEPLRGVIANGKHLAKVVHFGDQQVFENATTYTCLMFLDKAGHDEFEFERVSNLDIWRINHESIKGTLPATTATNTEWNFAVGSGSALFDKLVKMPTKLGDIANIFVGLQTSADTVFLFKDCQKAESPLTKVQSKELGDSVEIETNILKSVVRSGEIGRYWATPSAEVLFPYETIDGKFKLIPENRLKKDFQKAWKYLLSNKELLAGREHGKFKDVGWYQLYPKNLDTWEQPKIMLPYMITRLAAFYDETNFYFVNVTTGGFGITIHQEFGDHKYITGLLNSTLLDWFMKKVSTTFHGGYFAANKQFLVQLPIRLINFSDPAEKAMHDKMVSLVERMLELHKRPAARTPQEQEMVKREIESTDVRIDRLVYELYGLTEDEVRIVEG